MPLPAEYSSFQAGLNTRSAPFLLDEGTGTLPARDLSNVQSTLTGAIVKRAGLVTFASPATALTSLFPLESVGPFMIGATGTTLISVSTGGATASIKTALTSGKRWEWVSAPIVSAQGPAFGMSGFDIPQQWSGTGNTANWTATDAGGTVPNGTYSIYFGNQVFVSGVAATPSRVYWSGIADPTAWNPANLNGSGFEDFDPGDGQAITALGRVGPYVLVAKPRKLWVIIDPATATTRRISDQVGCVAHRSMVEGSEGTYFLSEDRGVFLTNGSTLKPVSDQIQPTIDLVAGQKANAVGGYFNGHYYLSVAGGGSGGNDTTLDWDASLGSWWKHSFGSNQFAVWHPSTTANLYSAKSTAAIVDQCFATGVNTDNGSAFQWVWRGAWQSPSYYRRRLAPTPHQKKRLRKMRFFGSGTVDLSLATDFVQVESLVQANALGTSASATNWGGSGNWGAADGSAWGGGGSVTMAEADSLGVARAFSIVFSATSTTADSIDLYTLFLTDRKDGIPA